MIDGGRAKPRRCTCKWFPPQGPGSSPVVRRGGASRGCMTNFMRKVLAGIWLAIALAALVGLVAHLSGADLGGGARPMLFGRALGRWVGPLSLTLKRRRRSRRAGAGRRGGGRASRG